MSKLPYSFLNRDRYSRFRNVQSLNGSVSEVDEKTAVLDGKIENYVRSLKDYLNSEFEVFNFKKTLYMRGGLNETIEMEIETTGYKAIGVVRIIPEDKKVAIRGFGIISDGAKVQINFEDLTAINGSGETRTFETSVYVLFQKELV